MLAFVGDFRSGHRFKASRSRTLTVEASVVASIFALTRFLTTLVRLGSLFQKRDDAVKDVGVIFMSPSIDF